jgi:hypothetical protein
VAVHYKKQIVASYKTTVYIEVKLSVLLVLLCDLPGKDRPSGQGVAHDPGRPWTLAPFPVGNRTRVPIQNGKDRYNVNLRTR